MRHLLTALLALVAGFGGAALFVASGLSSGLAPDGGSDNTREYLLANPEVLPEAMAELQRREALARIEPLRGELEAPYPGAVLGNPEGSVTLVEFSDYACGFCRQSQDDVKALIAANPDLKVVVREYPILSEGSVDAARMALAAAQQGRYAQFHDTMFAAGRPTRETIEQAARDAGLDMGRARTAIEMGLFEAQLQTNGLLARQLGINGTPAWIVGERALNGAVGRESLEAAIAAARAG